MDEVNEVGVRVRIQKFGRFLSGMVMPNIGAFIAWGLITALFIPTGWIPNENLAKLVDPMIKYLLPLLIGYTGGKIVHDLRGGVVGAIATMGVIVGTDIPMFIGAMLMGPLGGWVIKKFDQAIEGKVKAGFEMLVNNFSAGIIAGALTLLSFKIIGPIVEILSNALASGVQAIVNVGLLPLANLIVEPAKILFLNNAINHGIFSPIGLQQASELGQSVFFLLEPNPGPGLGILLAYAMFARGAARESAPGAMIIHFLGGIHEIYFPYVLMNPKLIFAVMAGGVSGTFIFQLLHAGLVAVPSPGSIFALMAMAPKGGLFPVLAGVVVAAAVSFIVASIVIKTSMKSTSDEDLEQAAEKVQELKGKKVENINERITDTVNERYNEMIPNVQKDDVNLVVFACDAGMGSSAMGASILRKKFKEAGINIDVINKAISDIPEQADIVITQKTLTDRAKTKSPSAEHISVDNFLNSPRYDELVHRLSHDEDELEHLTDEQEIPHESDDASVLTLDKIELNVQVADKYEAIRQAGKILVQAGHVGEEYIEKMIDRENSLSTFMGNGVAIPHGTNEAKQWIKSTGISIVQIPGGVDFGNGNTAELVIGIAAVGDEHLTILSNMAEICSDEENVKKIVETSSKDEILKIFKGEL
ncbi:PTS mannitol transporter subunit IICBA [Ammoniphilus resinae]|uniref:Mannitol-specific phosphotransferase enzyme IIA component n=1 Tax=Ammoniphilus resinae TaxID=861532 RepID=A0ABS4GWS2_9BACL|nr:PTS mannitol transporter subunit IICBA [Ammoniphilus resinae]MBP1934733.1 PTS system mannitol-specific IIC component [Ammoniphilus resinae]